MNKPVQVLLYCLSFIVLLTNCEDKFERYERPANLAAPLYQQLDSMGNFTKFLALVDKAGYKRTLSAAGYWTLFAPTDAAFDAYFQKNNISGLDAIDSVAARGIVEYNLVFNAYTVERLSDYQSPIGWVEDEAYKRKTAYYDGVYMDEDAIIDGQIMPAMPVISDNRHVGGHFVPDDGHKYIPYFTEEYFSTHNLSATDYNYFYPNTPYIGFNVVDAQVESANIYAENGILHIVDQVIAPLDNVEQHLSGKEEYSVFTEILERYLTEYDATSVVAAEVTEKYRVLTSSGEPVSIKAYDPRLIFGPNMENWQDWEAGGEPGNLPQSNTNTIFVPKNEAVQQYVDNMLLQYFEGENKTVGMLPLNVIADFVSAHMWSVPVWPTKFETTRNSFGDPARFDPAADVTEKKVLSNSFFYGTEKVLESNVFHSVYGRAYLDPKYSMMIRALGLQGKSVFTQRENYATMFLITDQALQDAGFVYDEKEGFFIYTPPTGAPLEQSGSEARLNRVINQHMAIMEEIDDLADLSGEGIIRTYGDEFVKYENGQLFTAGNLDKGERVDIEGPFYTENGTVYLLDQILEVSDKSIAQHLEENFGETYFWQYLINSTAYVNEGIEGTTKGSPYTVLVPADSAIENAIAAGLLPGTAGVPNFTPDSPIEKEKVANFIKHHIIAHQVLVNEGDNLTDISYETIYRSLEGEKGFLGVSDGIAGEGPTVITDSQGNTAVVIDEVSNVLSNNAVIHMVDGYLDYN